MKKMNAVTTFLMINGFMAFANSTMFTTYALYYITELGLNPFQLVLVGTFLEITILLFEIPTGVVADTYSRRLSVIIGSIILGAAYVLEGSIPIISETFFHGALSLFIGVILAEVIRGVGETFLSGAQQAWLADEIGVDKMGSVLLRGNRIYEAASIFGVLASVGLSSIALNLPYIVGGTLYFVLGIMLILFMPEQNFHRSSSEEKTPFRESLTTFKSGFSLVRGRPILVAFLFITLFIGAGSEGFDRLWEAHFISSLGFPDFGNFTTPVWFGIISLTVNVLCFFTAWIAERYIKFETERQVARYMVVFTMLRLLCIVFFSLAGSFEFALISFLLLSMTSTVTGPLYSTWVNHNIDSKVRATVLSMSSQMNAFGQMVGGPVVGAASSRFTLRIGLTFAAIIQLPILLIYLHTMKKNKMVELPKHEITR